MVNLTEKVKLVAMMKMAGDNSKLYGDSGDNSEVDDNCEVLAVVRLTVLTKLVTMVK